MADYLVKADLETLVGVDRVLRMFDDDVSGSFESGETSDLTVILDAAEAFVASFLLKAYPDTDTIAVLVAADPMLKVQATWIAIELASERRPEFCDDEGWGQFKAQYLRAEKYIKSISQGKKRSAGEATAGKGGQREGKIQPTETAGEADAFKFAPNQNSPTGYGGF